MLLEQSHCFTILIWGGMLCGRFLQDFVSRLGFVFLSLPNSEYAPILAATTIDNRVIQKNSPVQADVELLFKVLCCQAATCSQGSTVCLKNALLLPDATSLSTFSPPSQSFRLLNR